MRYHSTALILFIFLTILLTMGCDSGIFHRKISEGIIEYDVTYPNLDSTAFIASFLPNKMTMKFKKNQYVNELSAGMGAYKTNFISNSTDYLFINLVKLINKKYAMELDRIGVLQMIKKEYPNMSIIPVNETKIIAGYNCRKALIVFNDIHKNSFYVYYTDDINIYDPNWCLPFKEIGGVLLEYQLTNFNMETKLVATKVTKADVEDKDFIRPDDYEVISYEEMQKEVGDIFATFN